jgi:hypothetical protein
MPWRVLIEDPARADRMGAAGRARAVEHFSLDAFGERLEAVVRGLRAARQRMRTERTTDHADGPSRL